MAHLRRLWIVLTPGGLYGLVGLEYCARNLRPPSWISCARFGVCGVQDSGPEDLDFVRSGAQKVRGWWATCVCLVAQFRSGVWR